MVIPIGQRLFPLAPFILYIFVCTNFGLGCRLLNHALDIHEIVAPVLNRDIMLFLIMVTGKFVAYFMLLNFISIISSVHDSHSESDEESKLPSGLVESWGSLVSSGSDFVLLGVHVCPLISLTWSLGLCVLCIYLFV